MSEASNESWKERLLYTAKSDDRSRMRAVANNLILHLHPTKVPAPALRWSYTWGLGGISALLATMLVVTGVLLMFRYDASVERAYTSIQYLETQVFFGSLVRAIHHWSANLLIIAVFLHLLKVFFTGGFKKGRATNWIVGVTLLLLVAAMIFPGIVLLAIILIPYWDKNDAGIGIYFRSRMGAFMALVGALFALAIVPLLVLADEYWIDLPAMLPTWPTLLSNGLVPLLLSLAGLAIIYFIMRLGASLLFMKPRSLEGEFGGLVKAGPVESFPSGSVVEFPDGRFFLVRSLEGGFLAVYRRCTHLGCSVNWETDQNRFFCPCHASNFDLHGDVENPPAPRALDTFPVQITDGQVIVDTGRAQSRDAFAQEQLVYA